MTGEKQGSFNPSDLGKLLFEFENEKFEVYKKFTIKRFLAWQIIRRPLYYSLLRNTYKVSVVEKKRNKQLRNYIKALICFPFRLAWLCLFKRRAELFIVTNDAYKLEKNERNKEVNIFTDHWYALSQKRAVVIEYHSAGKKEKHGALKTDLDTNAIQFIVRIVTWLFLKLKWSNRTTLQIANELGLFFNAKGFSFYQSKNVIDIITLKFLVDFYIYRFLFFCLRPRVLIVIDSVGTGVMAAAIKNDIKVIELQHGLLDTYKPDYVLAPCLLEVRRQLVLPTFLALFGDYYKSFLKTSGFWCDETLAVIGNMRIDKYRHAVKIQVGYKDFTILIPTQWTFFSETKEALEVLIHQRSAPTDYKILIKTHPREPKEHIHWYKEFAATQKNVELKQNDISIYQLFAEANFVVGFDSTSLLESVALGIPTITVATHSMPKGLHTYNQDELLLKAIKISEVRQVKEIMDKLHANEVFRYEWIQAVQKASDYLYKKDCLKNCALLLNKVLSV